MVLYSSLYTCSCYQINIYNFVVPPNVAPRNLHILSYNTTTTVAIFQWDPIFFSNGPITGYKFYIGDNDGISIQGTSNTTYNAELNITSNIQVSVSVAAVNSAGESVPAAEVISLNGKMNTITCLYIMSMCFFFFQLPQGHCVHSF